MPTALDLAKKMLTAAGRGVELLLTGQSSFALITSDFAASERIADLVQAKRVMAEAQSLLSSRFDIRLAWPVLLELFNQDDWTPGAFYRILHGTLGYYQQQTLGEVSAHAIHVTLGLPRARFKSIVAHEITHAWERETGLLKSDRALREGFARWIEYQVLLAEGERDQAERLPQISTFRRGRAIRTLLEIERKSGPGAVLEYVRSVP
jgi:hypothetical protein